MLTAAALSAATAFAAAVAPATPPDPIYAALRAARPEGRAVAVSDWTLERDAFRFHFASGTFQFLPPVEGRTTGAVFVGMGEMTLTPATEGERRRLAFQTGDPKLEVLSDRFETLVLLFTDATAKDIESHASAGGSPPPSERARQTYGRFLKKQHKELKNNLQIRILEDLLEQADPARGLFLAYFDGKKLPPALAVVDPAGLDNQFSSEVGGEGVALYGLDEQKGGYWYLSHMKTEIAAGRLSGARPRGDAERYVVETAIAKNARIRGTTTITFTSRIDGLRVLPVALLGKLRVREAAFSREKDASWMPAALVQEDEEEDADLAVVFPEPMPAGRTVRLRLSYEGKDVLRDAGDGNFLVGARDSWYPNLGTFTDLAAFDMTYRCPKGYQVVSVGELVADRVEGDERVSVWKSERPIRVAGFNYGKFRKLERTDADSGITVAVYTNPGEPDFVREINFLLENRRDAGLRHISASAESLADSALADGINTARVGATYFGRLPQQEVSITQQTQAFFGQSWPSLIYLPYIAAFDSTIRHEMGLQDAAEFVDLVGPHEFAHQWWGHRVGWQSYRDQWLSEGFAEFTAALVLQYTGGLAKSNTFWERSRQWIEMKPRYASVANDEAGPISDGWRVSTWRNRSAAQAMIYSKGAYVLHMLRMLMRDDAASPPDANFIAMLKDFVATEADKNPSTRDFQAAVERHMTPAMNAAGDGKMEWFFRQWVYGTEIPRIKAKLEVTPLEDGRYRIHGSVTQDGVAADFRTVAVLYVEFKGEVMRVGRIPLTGSTTAAVDLEARLPKPPSRALVNALHDVLYRD
ncbi:MAG: M1 family aminopeptidase [Acidobacteriota bacterium]